MPLEFRLGRRQGDTEIELILFHQNGDLTSIQLDASLASVSTSVAGDFEEDGDVDGEGFLFWQRNGLSAAELIEWEANYGMPSSPALSRWAAVPEPASAWLILGAALCHWIVSLRWWITSCAAHTDNRSNEVCLVALLSPNDCRCYPMPAR